MASLDPVTDFWTSQGGQQDLATKSWSDMHDAAGERSDDTYETRVRRDSDDMEQSVRGAIDEAKSRSADADDWSESGEHRSWLADRYPGTNVSDYAAGMLDWHGKFKNNPHGAAEEWVRTWAQQPPIRPRSKAVAERAKPPDGMKEYDRGDWLLHEDAKAAYAAAAKDRADRDAFSQTAELRQRVKQETGMSWGQFLDCCKQIDEASSKDAASIAQRFAQFSGAAATPQHGAELQAQNLLSHVIESNALPGLGHDDTVTATTAAVLRTMPRSGDQLVDLQTAHGIATQRLDAANQATDWARSTLPDYGQLEETIADVLRHPQFRRSGHMQTDLSLAHAVARDWAASGYRSGGGEDAGPTHQLTVTGGEPATPAMGNAMEKVGNAQAKLQSMAADKARRASRSISGSPSPGGASSQHQNRDNDAWQDAAAAYRASSPTI